jgi:hypothetical protein
MSNVSTAHTVTLFDAKKSQPLSGQRLAKVRYKTTEKQAAKYPSVCVSVPFVDRTVVAASIDRLMPYVMDLVQIAQDGVIRSLYESAQGSLSHVTDSDISIDACIGYLEAESQGTRLTKEFIDAWFDATVRDTCYVLFAEKLGYGTENDLTPEQDTTVCKHIAGYRGMYSALAGGKTMYQPAQVRNLRKVLELCETDETLVKLDTRLAKMLEAPTIAQMLDLD